MDEITREQQRWKKCYNCHFYYEETKDCWVRKKKVHHLSYCVHWLEVEKDAD